MKKQTIAQAAADVAASTNPNTLPAASGDANTSKSKLGGNSIAVQSSASNNFPCGR